MITCEMCAYIKIIDHQSGLGYCMLDAPNIKVTDTLAEKESIHSLRYSYIDVNTISGIE